MTAEDQLKELQKLRDESIKRIMNLGEQTIALRREQDKELKELQAINKEIEKLSPPPEKQPSEDKTSCPD